VVTRFGNCVLFHHFLFLFPLTRSVIALFRSGILRLKSLNIHNKRLEIFVILTSLQVFRANLFCDDLRRRRGSIYNSDKYPWGMHLISILSLILDVSFLYVPRALLLTLSASSELCCC